MFGSYTWTPVLKAPQWFQYVASLRTTVNLMASNRPEGSSLSFLSFLLITSSVWNKKLGNPLLERGFSSELFWLIIHSLRPGLPVRTPNGGPALKQVRPSPIPLGFGGLVLHFKTCITPACPPLGQLRSCDKAAASQGKILTFIRTSAGSVLPPGSYESDGLNAVLVQLVEPEMLSNFFLQKLRYGILGALTSN